MGAIANGRRGAVSADDDVVVGVRRATAPAGREGVEALAAADEVLDAARACARERAGQGMALSHVVVVVSGPDGRTRRRVFRPPTPPAPVRHGPDYRSVYWFGTAHPPFTALQAAVVKILWEAWENGTPDVGDAYLLEEAGSAASAGSVANVFQGHPAWTTMISSRQKGSHYLHAPA